MSTAKPTAGYFIPASPGKQIAAHITHREWSEAQVLAMPGLESYVREQGTKIRADFAENSEVWWTGRGYHRTSTGARAFAFRALISQGELQADPTDSRRYIAA